MTATPPLENLKLSTREKDALMQIRRLTGIEQWNVLCRWAFCLSLAQGPIAEDAPVPPSDSNLEMSWRTFAGECENPFLAVLGARSSGQATDEGAAKRLRHHLARGIGLLQSRVQGGQIGRGNVARLAHVLTDNA